MNFGPVSYELPSRARLYTHASRNKGIVSGQLYTERRPGRGRGADQVRTLSAARACTNDCLGRLVDDIDDVLALAHFPEN